SPFKDAELEVIYGEGVSREAEILTLGEMAGILKKSGSWFSFGEYRLGQGRDTVRQFLKENPEIGEQMLLASLEKLNIDPKIALD
ncbi:MAG: DNA recombination/repair protein RecA, partial [bacterium]